MRDGGGKFVGLGAVAVARDCRAGAVTIALSLPSTAVGLDGSCFPLICSQEHLIEHFNFKTTRLLKVCHETIRFKLSHVNILQG